MSESQKAVTLDGTSKQVEVPQVPQLQETNTNTTEDAKSQFTPGELVRKRVREADKDIPEGMSKKQWKKLKKRELWELNKEKNKVDKRVKKKQARLNKRLKIQELLSKGEEIDSLMKKKHKKIEDQIKTGCKIIIDCEFDELMMPKEVISLSNQITRCYSDNKKNNYNFELIVSSFNNNLKERFEKSLSDYTNWDKTGIQFTESKMEDLISDNDSNNTEYKREDVIYLTADTDEKIEELKKGETYIIGGIVDKGRYKNLCKDKADKLNLKKRRLPIDEFIKLSGRKVLATSHVVELLIKWFEFKDWKKAFDEVIPQRKLASEEETTPEIESKEKSIDATTEESTKEI
ncbi:hypothetical protein B5S30_g5562 [[Candida] boidinii]|nr:hypothetical protein B5S30_g5562 [[Candida] boidinii]